ncbi:MAG: 4Fe-4S dicluster domain-containing protein [Bryobacteraceae bacterium]|nr:4Fe-4S dicluster domain-containing protein [Bryobacteraceae bacterium]
MNLAEAVTRCYQCGKCTAGCPQAERMDLTPNQILRLVQLGLSERAARADAIWKCVSCLTCSTRCPQEVDCAGVMDQLRQMAAAEDHRTLLFQRAFLRNVRRHGRLNELELTALFKTRAMLAGAPLRFLFQEAPLAPRMYAKGKLRWKGAAVDDTAVVERIFTRCGE